jgi:hypothetical protein
MAARASKIPKDGGRGDKDFIKPAHQACSSATVFILS